MKVPFSGVAIQHKKMSRELVAGISSVIESGQFILGEAVVEFENIFAQYHQVKHAIGVGSGTDALFLSLRALGVQQGDEVIVSSNTFMTTVTAIVSVGAIPVLIDVGDDDNLDIALIESKITDKTAAILPVHWTGRPCMMDKIVELCKKYNLFIIEDCAQAIGARYQDKLVGTFGNLGCFSLHPFKTLNACGDAGIIITDDDVLAERLQRYRSNGFSKDGICHYWSHNSRLDTLQAKILSIKMSYLEDWTQKRREIAEFYYKELCDIGAIKLPDVMNKNFYSVYHTFIIHVKKRNELMRYLAAQGIETRVHYDTPIHKQPVSLGVLQASNERLSKLEAIAPKVLSLPIYPELTQEQLNYIVAAIKKFYKEKPMQVPYSYLERQFSDIDPYLNDLREFVKTADFTLGKELKKFESLFADLHNAKHAIGVGTGTDALAMSLKILGIGSGDEVITCANTFIATVGAIVQVGATPVFVDSENGYVIDVDKIEDAITQRTKAIMPVHYTGNIADMPRIKKIADKYNLKIIEDACQTILGAIDGQSVGSWGETAAFSLHPLKNLNVWSDAGVIITNSDEHAEKLRLYRNHGLVDRDTCVEFGINCRMDTLQAVIANRLIGKLKWITEKRQKIALSYDKAFADLNNFIDIPIRRKGVNHVFHIYVLRVRYRDQLLKYLNDAGVEAKIHYPIPMHLQPAAKYLGYKRGDFPVAEQHGEVVITLPAHPYLTDEEVAYTIETVRGFYLNHCYEEEVLATMTA